MKKIHSFDSIPGTVGVVRKDGLELVITGSRDVLEKTKSYLTTLDESVAYQIKRLKSQPAYNPGHAAQKDLQILQLQRQLNIEYYGVNDDGSLSVPPGFWWVCEEISGHENPDVPYVELPETFYKKPRPYQIESVKAMLENSRSITELPTGTGKTLVTIMLTHCALEAGKRVLIIVPTIDLVSQTLSEIKRLTDDCTGLGGSFKYKEGKRVLVTTINSAGTYSDAFNFIIADEVHRGAGATYSNSILLSPARHVYGMSATPVRQDGDALGFHALCGPVVYRKSTRWAIDSEYLAPVNVALCRVQSSVPRRLPDTVQKQTAYKLLCGGDSKGRPNGERYGLHLFAVLARSLKHAEDAGMSTLVLFKTREPGEQFAKFYNGLYGTNYMVAHSGFRAPLYTFQKDETKVLISNSSLLGEGIDIPRIDCVLTVANNANESLTRQVLGRGLRLFPGKPRLLFLDFAVMGYGSRNDQFEGAAQARLKVYRTITDDIVEFNYP